MLFQTCTQRGLMSYRVGEIFFTNIFKGCNFKIVSLTNIYMYGKFEPEFQVSLNWSHFQI